jgi:periplasmic divalent cation tolerance protein
MHDEFLQIVTTASSQDEANRLSRTLIERRLAGCVQVVGPIESTYRWEGNIETATEWQCWIKARRQDYGAVEQAIHELHSYEVPEILALPVIAGSQRYLHWLAEAVQRDKQ